MKREMARRVLARHPDDTFYYADDALRLTPREILKIVVGSFIGLAWVLIVLFAIAFAGTAP